MTDWIRRPLADAALTYAAADVAHLLDVAAVLREQLEAAGRLAWAEEECEKLRLRRRGVVEPEAAWWRIKEARHLRGAARSVAQTVAAWRERKAAETDQPPRFVLADMAVVTIAQHPPTTIEDLRGLRGVDGRHLRGRGGREILAAVQEGVALPREQLRVPATEEVDRTARPAVALASAWISQLAGDLRIDTPLLATRGDIEALLRGDPEARLAHGWRHDLVGEHVRHLLDGRAALAFDGRGGLVLEERSGREVRVEAPLPPTDFR